MIDDEAVPVCLFTYARPECLRRVLECLRREQVPLLYVFSDGGRDVRDQEQVKRVRSMIDDIDWTKVYICKRESNLGLGANVLQGVSEVAKSHSTFIVWEDDLICTAGAYRWMAFALRRYEHDPKVGSITAWTHSRIVPKGIGSQPYFDGRAECWVWGSWRRAWAGMQDENANAKMRSLEMRGINRNIYGTDLPRMAKDEERRNIWAVRWLYHHIQRGFLCLRPPWSMVDHIGFDANATNAAGAVEWAGAPLRAIPPVPEVWPQSIENPQCLSLWRGAIHPPSILKRFLWRLMER